jgi:prolyl oligopeptidase
MHFGKWALGVVMAGTIAGAWHAMGAAKVNEAKINVEDSFIWLEDVHGAKPLAWVKEQNARSLATLKADPDYQKYYDTILAVLDAKDRIPYGQIDHNSVFNFWQDAEHPKGVWRRTTIADYANPNPKWEILIDLDKLSGDEHEDWVWKGADCAPSLTHCLVNLSRGGGDAVVVREFDLGTKSFVKDGFQLAEAKSQIGYLDEDTVLVGTDFGPGSMTTSGYPRVLKLWKRGEPLANAKALLEGKNTDVLVGASISRGPSGTTALAVRAITFYETEYSTMAADGSLKKLPLPLSADVKGVAKGNLIFTLREDWTFGGKTFAKGSLLAMPLMAQSPPGAGAAVPAIVMLYVPGPRDSVEQVAIGRDAVYASIYENVTGSVHAFRPLDPGKWSDAKLDLPPGGSTHLISTNDWGPEAEFSFESYLVPPTLYHDTGDNHPMALKQLPARFDASGLTMAQFEATSRDGTKIPYFVVRAKNLTGPAPTVLYGYGGFEISMTPGYSANFGKLWLTKGGVYAIANIRGGGEFGPAWHDAALKTNRQKAYEDFQAVAADLVRRKITAPKQLGIMGGSNGGLLVSANMVERPDLFGAVVCQVPLIDMLRYTHIGAGASWIAEYGDPADPKMREAILKYSPYQNVKRTVKYPPVFFVTATSDDRVTPVHARKMAARMEAQGHDVLFYENTDGGHAAAADHKQAAEMWALSFVYLKQKLGLHSAASTAKPAAVAP